MKLIIPRFISLLFLFFSVSYLQATEVPKIFWASSPVKPNETVIIQGGNFSEAAKIEIAQLDDGAAPPLTNTNLKLNWEEAQILQMNLSSIKFLIPDEWKLGVYACRIVDEKKESDIYWLNAPDVWWTQGNKGENPSTEGWLRIMGNCFLLDSLNRFNPMVKIKNSGGDFLNLPITDASRFDINVSLPGNIEEGEYELFVHNGYGGSKGWQNGGKIVVATKKELPPKIYNVKKIGLKNALVALKKDGGGVLYFPSGEYKMDSSLIIPDNVTIRGEAMELSVIYWNDLDKNKIPEALIEGKNFQIEDISIYCQNMYHNTIKAENGSFTMKRVRVRANPYFMLGRTGHEITFRGRTLNGELHEINAVVNLSEVDGFELKDCDIVGYDGIKIWNSSNGIISNCKIQYGRNGFGCEAAYHVIVENSSIEGMDMAATGNFFATYWGNSGEYMFLKNNLFANAYGLDQEFFTFDATGGAYMGKINKTNANIVELANDPVFKRYAENADNWVNSLLCIMDGKGAGQYRKVKKHFGREWEIDAPWDIEPDTGSVISIIPFRGNTIISNNIFRDGGAVQFYGTSIRNIIAENTGIRMSGFYIWGQESRGWGWQPSWYNQVLDNKITEGYNYRHQATRLAVLGTVSHLHTLDYDGPLSRCAVIRNNHLSNNCIISVSGQSSDVVIENNRVQNSEFGIAVEKQSQTGIDVNSRYYKDHSMSFKAREDMFGILIRNNTFLNVENLYSGDGIKNARILTVQGEK